MSDPDQTSLKRFTPTDILAWFCDRLSPAEQRLVLRAMIARADALLEPGVPPSQMATSTLEMMTHAGAPLTFAVSVQVQDRDALQAVQQGSISGSLIVRSAIWLDATDGTQVVHVGAVCLIAGRTVATLVAGPDRLEIEIASHAFDRTLDLDDVNA